MKRADQLAEAKRMRDAIASRRRAERSRATAKPTPYVPEIVAAPPGPVEPTPPRTVEELLRSTMELLRLTRQEIAMYGPEDRVRLLRAKERAEHEKQKADFERNRATGEAAWMNWGPPSNPEGRTQVRDNYVHGGSDR